jgi:hypothetical protein
MEYFFRCNGNFIIHMEKILHEIDSIWKNYYIIKNFGINIMPEQIFRHKATTVIVYYKIFSHTTAVIVYYKICNIFSMCIIKLPLQRKKYSIK